MTIWNICREDPLVHVLHDLLGANIVRIPDARIQPLTMIAHRDGRSFFRGALLPLLHDQRPLGLLPTRSLLTDIAGRRTRSVTLDLGLHILQGFLRGFGLPSATISAGLQGASNLSFAFGEVYRSALDINALGWALAGRAFDRGNPAAAVLFEQPPYDILLIDSVLTSKQIRIAIDSSGETTHRFDLSALHRIVAEIGGSIDRLADHRFELRLDSPSDLTFAFTCVRLFYSDAGKISAIPPDYAERTLGPLPLPVRYSPDRVLLSAQPGLLIWDRLQPAQLQIQG